MYDNLPNYSRKSLFLRNPEYDHCIHQSPPRGRHWPSWTQFTFSHWFLFTRNITKLASYSYLRLGLNSALFPEEFPIKWCINFSLHMRTTSIAHLYSFHYNIKYELWSHYAASSILQLCTSGAEVFSTVYVGPLHLLTAFDANLVNTVN